MTAILGKQFRIWIEESTTGLVMELENCTAINIEDRVFLDSSVPQTTVTLTSNYAPKWMAGESFAASVKQRRTAKEWRCDCCDRVNLMEMRTCEGCGAPRSFILN